VMRRPGVIVACNWGDHAADLPVPASAVALSNGDVVLSPHGVAVLPDGVVVALT